jgi:hypothetical protein
LAPKAVELVDRVADLVVVCRSCSMGVIDSRYCVLAFTCVCNISSIYFPLPFRRFLGDVRREFLQRLSTILYVTWGSYLRDVWQEGSAYAVASLPVPRAHA